ncbi:phage portal protein [Roseomonas xinghualingensis]|uniref:phage portal protein n=1 Tax=Roseomonas xinghualingensis TaxID=2986475 RepID=UPI0021F10410|nr:phage portal protein [Roseomonas sp. SXEYE001]MCV4209889.1 phage portal protein [Roseomonas sp. SXEYE001]
MSIFDIFRRPPQERAASEPAADAETFWGWSLDDPRLVEFMRSGAETASGVTVTPETALKNLAVFRCVDLISSTIGSLPLYLYRQTADGRLEQAKGHPLHDLLLLEPNNFQSPFDFKAQMQGNALIDGDAYALVVRSRGRVFRLIPLDSNRVCWRQNDDWSITYTYQRPKGGSIDYQQADILHLRGLTRNGIAGVSRAKVAREAIGLALQAEKAAARLFRNGLLAGGVLSHPSKLSEPAIARLKAGLDAKTGAENAHRWLVTEEGMKLDAFPSTGQNSQHVEQRRLQIEEVARAFGVPRPLLMMDDTSWGSGIEQLGILFVRFGLQTWFKAWEEAIGRACLTLDERRAGMIVDFDERELLRGSMKDQAEYYAKALGAGGHRPWMKQNEVRDVVGLGRDPDPEADKLSNPMTQTASMPGQGGGDDAT